MRRLEWVIDLLSLNVLRKAMCPTWGVSENGQETVLDFTHSFIRSVNQSQGGSYSMTGIEHTAVNIINIVPTLKSPF